LNLNDALKEIAEYKKIDFETILKEYKEVSEKFPGFVKWSNLSAKEWNEMKIDQNDITQVMEFYKKTPNYIFELMEYHSTESKQKLSKTVIDICKINKIKSILDFGAGICQDSITAVKSGLDATAADIPGKTFDYGKWRINKQNQIIKTIDISNETPLIEKYDAITCFEVLQHVINPKKTLGHLREHLKDEGLVFITTRFKNNYSLALKHNEYLENEFEDFVKKCNFQIKNKIHMWGEKEKTKNLYVLTK
jgi:2-polyprenyl-3-methyl-5-hydroxy-6-metoxy-1,4-benzoquinol methylase